ncbi:MAG: hypothetical protein IKX22_07115 [Prevotella sp.]|nr:hypothetical protein [Prevotella sp.]
MMFRLLDIPRIPREDEFLRYQRWLRRHSQDVVDTVSNSGGATDSVGSGSQVADTLNAGQAYMGNIGSGGDDASTMVWAIFAVFFALSLCLWFVWSYRHRSLTPSV